jgi:phage baseplate assembly protein W
VYQLKLVNGDLMIGADGSYVTCTGVDRIRQDLTLALDEVYQADRFHPDYGSILHSYLGAVSTPGLTALVRAEVNRVCQNYLAIQQRGVIQSSVVDVRGTTSSYDTSDVVRSIDDITVKQGQDTIYVTARVTTLAHDTVNIGSRVSG